MTKKELLQELKTILEQLKDSDDKALLDALRGSVEIVNDSEVQAKRTIFVFFSVLVRCQPHKENEKIKDFYLKVEDSFFFFSLLRIMVLIVR